MDLFRSPGIAPPPLPGFQFGLPWSRRYGHLRVAPGDATPAANDEVPPAVDQDFEEYEFE